MGNSAVICERHYAPYVPGAHDRIAGVLDAAPTAPAPKRDGERAPVDFQVTPEGAAARVTVRESASCAKLMESRRFGTIPAFRDIG